MDKTIYVQGCQPVYVYRWLSAFKFFFLLWTSWTDQFCRCRLYFSFILCIRVVCMCIVFSPFFSSRNNNLTRMHTRYYVRQIRSHPAFLHKQHFYTRSLQRVFSSVCSSGRWRRLPSIFLPPRTDNIILTVKMSLPSLSFEFLFRR